MKTILLAVAVLIFSLPMNAEEKFLKPGVDRKQLIEALYRYSPANSGNGIRLRMPYFGENADIFVSFIGEKVGSVECIFPTEERNQYAIFSALRTKIEAISLRTELLLRMGGYNVLGSGELDGGRSRRSDCVRRCSGGGSITVEIRPTEPRVSRGASCSP